MKLYSPAHFIAALILPLLLASACADGGAGPGGRTDFDSGDTDDDPSDQGQPDDGTPDNGTPDNGTPDNGTPDNGTLDGSPDTGETDGGDDPIVDLVDDQAPPECAIDTTLTAIPTELSDGNSGTRPARIIIEAVDFENDIVFIRNITNLTGANETINFDADWGIAVNTSQWNLGVARNLPPSGRMAIHLRRQGFNTATDTFLNLGGETWNLLVCGGEVVIQDRREEGAWTNRPEIIEAFVRWGSRNPSILDGSASFADEAFEAQAWLNDLGDPLGAVQVCWATNGNPSICGGEPPCAGLDDHRAIIAIGDVRDPEGWYSAPASEFVGCP